MDKSTAFYLTIISVIAIIILGAYIALNLDLSGYRYSAQRENVQFFSNSAEPAVIFQEMRDSKVFVISPQFVNTGPENAYMVSVVTMFSTVLVDKEKSVIVIGRVLDDSGNIVECQSNLGDVKTNEPLPLDECNSILNDSANVRVFVSLPDVALEKTRVVLEPKTIRVTPSSFEGVSHASYVVLDSLYDDTEKIFERVNQIVGRI